MIKGLGRVAISGIAAATLAVVGLAGAASAGMTGDAARSAGSAAGSEAVAAATTAQTAAWYGRGTVELAAGETARAVDRQVQQATAEPSEGSEGGRQASPIRDTLEQVSRTGAEVERAMVDTAETAADTLADASETAAVTLDNAEELLRR